MKFSLFVHMERLTEDEDQTRLYDQFLELCAMADDAGFETIWTGEHHGMDFTISPNPFLCLVDLARRPRCAASPGDGCELFRPTGSEGVGNLSLVIGENVDAEPAGGPKRLVTEGALGDADEHQGRVQRHVGI